MKTILDKDKSKLSSLIKNVQEALISRIESVDYITKTMKKQAIEQIKNKKHIFFPLYDDAFPGILDSIQVSWLIYLYKYAFIQFSKPTQLLSPFSVVECDTKRLYDGFGIEYL